MKRVTIIDYGTGNLLSVIRAFKYCNIDVEVVETAREVKSGAHLVLPGVGAFSYGMQSLSERGFCEIIHEHVQKGDPLLGICLGMQMLFDSSCEFGEWDGLSVVPGKVVPIPNKDSSGNVHKTPHVGWNELRYPEYKKSWEGSVLDGIEEGDAMYFVHSFMAVPVNPEDRLANCLYGGIEICAAIQKENVFGAQFHPEKSGELGLSIISSFVSCK